MTLPDIITTGAVYWPADPEGEYFAP